MSTKRKPNYKLLFYLGLLLIALGIVLSNTMGTNNSVFIAIGGLFLMASLANKEKWMNNKQ
jgi:hypothetical protein